MSIAVVKPKEARAQDFEWARMIPGAGSPVRNNLKKRPQPVRETFEVIPLEKERSSGSAFALLAPLPLQSRTGWVWLQSVIADWALVALNWLLLGAFLVPLRMLFPQVRSFTYDADAPIELMGMAILHAALITLVGYSEGLNVARSNRRVQARILAKSVLLATSVLCCGFLLHGTSWVVIGLMWIAGVQHFAGLLAWRLWERERAGVRADVRNVLIVGANPVGRRIASSIRHDPAGGRRVCGFLDDADPFCSDGIGCISDLARAARQHFVDEVILAAPSRDVTREVVDEARRLRLDIEIVPDLGCDPDEPEIEQVGGIPLICLHAERPPAAGLFLKRILDVVVAGTVLGAFAPLLATIALLIKLDSRGPVFYRAERAGRKGRFFLCHKFRTMVDNAEQLQTQLLRNNERDGPCFKIADDPRITRLGRYLRRFSLDELPQLWNVLKGEMSLVGPRPHPLTEYAGYGVCDLGRLDITPGITGLWQVTARRDPSFQRAMNLDREYIRNWSLALDFRILLKTLRVVVQGSGQ